MSSIPDQALKYTLGPNNEDESSGKVASTASVVEAGWDLREDGITTLRANGVEWDFGPGLPFRLLWFDENDLGSDAEIVPDSHWTTVTQAMSTSGSSATFTYTSAAGDTVVLRVSRTRTGSFSRPLDCFDFRVVSIDIQTDKRTLAGYDSPHLRVAPQGDPLDMSAVTPYMGGSQQPYSALPWPAGPLIAWHPGDGRIGTGMNYMPSEGGFLNQQPAGMQFSHCWDKRNDAGLMIISLDEIGRLKGFRGHGDNTFTEQSVRHAPANSRVRTTITEDDTYDVRVIPMVGDQYVAAREYQRTMTKELSPFFKEDLQQLEEIEILAGSSGWGGQFPGGLFNNRSYFLAYYSFQNYDVPEIAALPQAERDVAEAAIVNRMKEATDRWIGYMGKPIDAAVFYGTSTEDYFLERHCDHTVDFGLDLINHHRLTLSTRYIAAYSHFNLWSRHSKWMAKPRSSADPMVDVDPKYGYEPAFSDPDDVVPEDIEGNRVYGNGSIRVPPNVNGERWNVQLGAPAARQHMLDLMKRRLVEGDAANGVDKHPGLNAIYIDAHALVQGSGDDYHVAQNDEDKGDGAPYFWQGSHRVGREHEKQARLASQKNDFSFYGEWPGEYGALSMSGVSCGNNPSHPQISQAPIPQGLFDYVYGPYIGRIDFDSSLFAFGIEALPSEPAFLNPFFGFLDRSMVQGVIHSGKVLVIHPEYAGRPAIIQDQPSDPGYQIWQAHRRDTMEAIKNWYDLVIKWEMARWWNGQKLRPLRGSRTDNLFRNRFEVVTDETGNPIIKGVDWDGSAWNLQRSPKVRVLLTTGQLEEVTAKVVIDRESYPELPAGSLRVDELLPSGAINTGFATFENVWRQDIALEAKSARLFEISAELGL